MRSQAAPWANDMAAKSHAPDLVWAFGHCGTVYAVCRPWQQTQSAASLRLPALATIKYQVGRSKQIAQPNPAATHGTSTKGLAPANCCCIGTRASQEGLSLAAPGFSTQVKHQQHMNSRRPQRLNTLHLVEVCSHGNQGSKPCECVPGSVVVQALLPADHACCRVVLAGCMQGGQRHIRKHTAPATSHTKGDCRATTTGATRHWQQHTHQSMPWWCCWCFPHARWAKQIASTQQHIGQMAST